MKEGDTQETAGRTDLGGMVPNTHCRFHAGYEAIRMRVHLEVAEILDREPEKLNTFRADIARRLPGWAQGDTPVKKELMDLWGRPWAEIRGKFLDPSEEGKRLRSSSLMGRLLPQSRVEEIREQERVRARPESGRGNQ